MTVSAIAAGAGWWTLLAVAADAAIVAGSAYSAYSSYEQGKAAEQQAKAAAAENEYQAELMRERAAVSQIQGEEEAEKRSRILAAEVGRQYANWAGSGLLVDGSKDTFGNVLDSTVAEGVADITTIKRNAAINVWNYNANSASLLASAQNNRISGSNARKASTLNALGTSLSGVGSLIGSGLSSYGTFTKLA